MLGVGLEASPLQRHRGDSAAVLVYPLCLAVTEPRKAMAHADPSGKDKATGCSNHLKEFPSEMSMWM